jgi:hypothetical protein
MGTRLPSISYAGQTSRVLLVASVAKLKSASTLALDDGFTVLHAKNLEEDSNDTTLEELFRLSIWSNVLLEVRRQTSAFCLPGITEPNPSAGAGAGRCLVAAPA